MRKWLKKLILECLHEAPDKSITLVIKKDKDCKDKLHVTLRDCTMYSMLIQEEIE